MPPGGKAGAGNAGMIFPVVLRIRYDMSGTDNGYVACSRRGDAIARLRRSPPVPADSPFSQQCPELTKLTLPTRVLTMPDPDRAYRAIRRR
eukprot:2975976-Rhodomonas_salina.5